MPSGKQSYDIITNHNSISTVFKECKSENKMFIYYTIVCYQSLNDFICSCEYNISPHMGWGAKFLLF